MKRAARRASYALLLALAAVVLGIVAPRPLFRHLAAADTQHRRILVLSNPIHTDIAIPVSSDVLERFAFLRSQGLAVDLPQVRYIVFGWGSREFYLNTPTWSELRPGPLLRALTMDASVMHVSLAGEIAAADPAAAGFDLTEDGFRHLLAFIEQGFRQGPDGPERIEGASYGDHDLFFEANGNFTALAGCNTWTAEALRAAGLRTGWWTPLPATLLYSLRLHNPAS